MAFQYRSGHSTPLPIKILSTALTELYKRDSALLPEAIVTAATPVDAPLHGAFPEAAWNDELAAHEHRLSLARGIIRTVEVVNDDGDTTPAWVHVQAIETKGGGVIRRGYYPVDKVVRSSDMLNSALNALRSQVNAIMKTISELEAAAEVAGVATAKRKSAFAKMKSGAAAINEGAESLR